MTTAEARARIEDDTQWQATPALVTAEVDRLLGRAKVMDAMGLVPGVAGYVETYTEASVNGAVALGWRWKQGKVAADFDVSGDVGAKLSQQFDMCEKMARRYERGSGGVGSLSIVPVNALW